jgi:hypothetical protein
MTVVDSQLIFFFYYMFSCLSVANKRIISTFTHLVCLTFFLSNVCIITWLSSCNNRLKISLSHISFSWLLMTHNVVFLVKKYDLSHYISKKGDKTRIFFSTTTQHLSGILIKKYDRTPPFLFQRFHMHPIKSSKMKIITLLIQTLNRERRGNNSFPFS